MLLARIEKHQVCCGLIWTEMREQQEVKATGQRERAGWGGGRGALSDLGKRGNQYAGWETI